MVMVDDDGKKGPRPTTTRYKERAGVRTLGRVTKGKNGSLSANNFCAVRLEPREEARGGGLRFREVKSCLSTQ